MKNNQSPAIAKPDTASVLKQLEEGLNPILKNGIPSKLSAADKAEILEELDRLEQLALQLKHELSVSQPAHT